MLMLAKNDGFGIGEMPESSTRDRGKRQQGEGIAAGFN